MEKKKKTEEEEKRRERVHGKINLSRNIPRRESQGGGEKRKGCTGRQRKAELWTGRKD